MCLFARWLVRGSLRTVREVHPLDKFHIFALDLLLSHIRAHWYLRTLVSNFNSEYASSPSTLNLQTVNLDSGQSLSLFLQELVGWARIFASVAVV